MVKPNKTLVIQILIIGFISLLPFLWIHDGSVIVGHDAGTPINATAHFLDRLQTWTHRYGIGANQTFATPGIFIHGLEYVLDQIGLSISYAQGVSFFLYMFGMGTSMYLLVRTIFPDKKYAPLFAAVFYQINHFTLQAWFIAERTKFTTYILLPLLLMIIYMIARKKASMAKLSIITSILVTVLNGGGFLPLFGSILVIAPLWIVVLVLTGNNRIELIKKFLIFLILTSIFCFFLNIYWLYPYISYLRSSFGDVTNAAGGVEGVITWLKSISLNSSYSNLFRLQGIPEWYSNPNHPYAHTILNSKIFIIFSYMLPLLAFSSLLFAKKNKKIIALVVLTALVSIFFMAGSHPPLGWLYILLIKYVPGFIAFRTAFYKFAPGLWLSYSILIAFTLDYLLLKVKKPIKGLMFFGVIVGILAYSYPFFNKSFFNYDVNRTTLIKIPDYIHEYGSSSQTGQISFNRLLVLPPQARLNTVEHTEWDYWSLASVTSLLDKKSYINRSADLTEGERSIVNEIYNNLDTDNPEWMHLAERLNIDGILLRDDTVPYNQDGQKINSSFYKEKLDKLGYKKIQSIGKWSIYKFADPNQDVTLFAQYAVVKDLRRDVLFPDLGFQFSKVIDNDVLIVHADQSQDPQDPRKKADIILPACEKCSLPGRKTFDETRDIVFIPGSRFYGIKKFIEKKAEPTEEPIKIKLEYKTRQTLRRSFEMRRTLEQRIDRGERIGGWNYYRSQVEELDILVSDYLSSHKKTTEDNEFLNLIFDNVDQQINELNAMSEEITDSIEGVPFIELYRALNKVYVKLDQNTYKTDSINLKKFMFPITSDGAYDVWVDTLSLLTPSHASPEAELNIQLNNVKTRKKIRATDKWTMFTSQELKKGTHTLEITDPTSRLNINSALLNRSDIEQITNNQFILKAKKQEDCKILELGVLPKDKYRIAFNIRSEKQTSKVSVFIDSDKINEVLLPELTNTLHPTEIGSDHYENDFISNGVSPSILKICQLFTQQRDNLIFSDMSLDRITSPKIALIKNNNRFASKEKPGVNINKISNTSYEVNLAPHEDVYIKLNQRFDPGWSLNIQNQSLAETQTKASFYAQAWRIPASQDDIHIQLIFKPQNDFEKGLYISFISFGILIIGYVALTLWKKK